MVRNLPSPWSIWYIAQPNNDISNYVYIYCFLMEAHFKEYIAYIYIYIYYFNSTTIHIQFL